LIISARRSGINVDEEMMVGALIILLGADGLKIYDTFVFANPGDARKIEPVLDKFTVHFEPRRCEVYERFKFLKRLRWLSMPYRIFIELLQPLLIIFPCFSHVFVWNGKMALK
jgi:hypothetical protein